MSKMTYIGKVAVDANKVHILGSLQDPHQMVSIKPGMGNGVYEIYGEYKQVPGHGYCLVSLQMQFVSDLEIKEMIKDREAYEYPLPKS
ncbi:MAG: hypothetical protein ACRC5C_01800 [Bacilli bacterium]